MSYQESVVYYYRSALLLYVGFLLCSVGSSDDTWDVLVFSQQWPATACVEWKEKQAQHTCIMPPKHGIWSIHGIWPSKFHSFGPFFCHSSLHFNVSQLDGIEADLLAYWTNVDNGTNTHKFWKHEWKKHGTCASSLPFLDTELKYFSQALTWAKEYNAADVLGKAGITPNSQGYVGQDVWAAVKKTLGTDSMVHCITDQAGEVYLAELRICFNKSLELTDCDGVSGSATHTNCPADKPALYPAPPASSMLRRRGYSPALQVSVMPTAGPLPRAPWLLDLLHAVQLLQWITL